MSWPRKVILPAAAGSRPEIARSVVRESHELIQLEVALSAALQGKLVFLENYRPVGA